MLRPLSAHTRIFQILIYLDALDELDKTSGARNKWKVLSKHSWLNRVFLFCNRLAELVDLGEFD